MSRLRELAEEERNMELAAEAAWKMAGGECEGAPAEGEEEEQGQEQEGQVQEQDQEQEQDKHVEEEEEQDEDNVIIFLYLIAIACALPVHVSNRAHFSTCGFEIRWLKQRNKKKGGQSQTHWQTNYSHQH